LSAALYARSRHARQSQPQTVFVLTLRAEPGSDAIRGLRALLKRALRSYGLRAISVIERDVVEAQIEAQTGDETP